MTCVSFSGMPEEVPGWPGVTTLAVWCKVIGRPMSLSQSPRRQGCVDESTVGKVLVVGVVG